MFGFKKKKGMVETEMGYLQKHDDHLPDTFCKNLGSGASTGDFQMFIHDVFSITGRGTVITGKIDYGQIRIGEAIWVGNVQCKVKGIEMFRKNMNTAQAGDNVGLLIDIPKSNIMPGTVVTK